MVDWDFTILVFVVCFRTNVIILFTDAFSVSISASPILCVRSASPNTISPRDLNHARSGLVHGEPSQALMLEAREAVRDLHGTQHQRPRLARVPDACCAVAAQLAYSDYSYPPRCATLFLRC